MEKILHRSTFLCTDEEDSQQREEHTHGSNQHRGDDSPELNLETSHAKGGST